MRWDDEMRILIPTYILMFAWFFSFILLNFRIWLILVPLTIIDVYVLKGGTFDRFRRKKEDPHRSSPDAHTRYSHSANREIDSLRRRYDEFHYDDADMHAWDDDSAGNEDDPPRRRSEGFHHDYMHAPTRNGYFVGDAWITPDTSNPNHAFADLYLGDRRVTATL